MAHGVPVLGSANQSPAAGRTMCKLTTKLVINLQSLEACTSSASTDAPQHVVTGEQAPGAWAAPSLPVFAHLGANQLLGKCRHFHFSLLAPPIGPRSGFYAVFIAVPVP